MAGETTNHFTAYNIPTSRQAGVLVTQFQQFEVLTTELQLADVLKVGELPTNALLHAVILKTDDLDSNGSEALVWDIKQNTTTFKAGITNATALAGTVAVGEPVLTTAATAVNLVAATAAATGAAGTINVTLIYSTLS